MGGDNGPLNVCNMTHVINFELISVEIIVHCMVVVLLGERERAHLVVQLARFFYITVPCI